jgi:hypothetical protein
MSTEDATAPELLTAHEVQRVAWFEEIGFGTFEALELASARDSAGQLVTVHDVRKAIEGGCSVELAFQIFR